MKKRIIESFCLLLFTGILSTNAYYTDRANLPEKELTETATTVSKEITYDMEELQKGLTAGIPKALNNNANLTILEYTTYDNTSEDSEVSVEKVDMPKAEAVDLSKIKANVPNDEKGCKSYKKTHMSYTTITCRSSNQYKLQKKAYTDKKSGIRMVDDYYLIAVGSYYADHIGEKLIVTMKSGKQIPCMVGEFKSDKHTDKTHRYHVGGYDHGVYYPPDGSVIEFVVDTNIYKPKKQPDKFDGRIYAIHEEKLKEKKVADLNRKET